MKNLEKINNSVEVYQSLIEAIRNNARLFIYIGLLLKRIRDEKLYLNIGNGGYDTFEDFMNNPELGMRYTTGMLYIRVAEYYHLKLGLTADELAKISLFKLMRLLPVLKEKEDSESKSIVLDAGELTNNDFDVLIRESKWIPEKPIISKDKETGLYNITFFKGSTQKVYESVDRKLIWHKDMIEGTLLTDETKEIEEKHDKNIKG